MDQKDLSIHHEPIGDAFSPPLADATRPLGPSVISTYRDSGFVSGIQVLNTDQIQRLRDDLGILMEPHQAENPAFYEYHHNESDDPSMTLFHALGAWRVSGVFHDLIFHRPIVAAAEQLLEGPVRFWHDQLFVKPARDGAVVAWHQDYSYWTRTKPMAHLSCWIGLDDSTEENGCVRYIPGSHKWDLLPRYHLSNDMHAVFEFLTDEQRAAFDPVPAVLKAGEASFHHPLTLHGSYENTSPFPRRAVVLNFVRDGVVSDSDEPLLAGIPPIEKGKKLEGQFFPLLSQ